MIKRNSTDAALIAMLLDGIYSCKKQFCDSGEHCKTCLLGDLDGVFGSTTCFELKKVEKRLNVLYGLVEKL